MGIPVSVELWIPGWVVWAVGIVGLLALVILAGLGVLFIAQSRAFSRTIARHFGW